MPPKPKKYYAVRVGRHPGIYITWQETQKEVIGFEGAIYKSFTTLQEAQEYMHTGITKLRAVKPIDDNIGNKVPDLDKLLDANLDDVSLGNSPQQEVDIYIPHLKTAAGNDSTSFLLSTPDDWTYHQGEFYLATDGSFNTKSRRSGWAIYLGRTAYNLVQEMPLDTTNNRCELLAIQSALSCIIEHLGHLRLSAESKPIINIITDSQLCVSTFTKWISGWKKKGWKLASGEEPKNLLEIQEIDRLIELIRGKGIQLEFIHQRAHTSGLTAKFKTQKERLLWQINYIVDNLAQQLTS